MIMRQTDRRTSDDIAKNVNFLNKTYTQDNKAILAALTDDL